MLYDSDQHGQSLNRCSFTMQFSNSSVYFKEEDEVEGA